MAPGPRRLSNRAIIGLGLVLCIVAAVLLAWYLGVLALPRRTTAVQ